MSGRHPRRIGVFGGTFDPVHVGHLIAAEEVRAALRLDRVVFVPAGDPPHKRDRRKSAAEHRVAMLEIAIGDHEVFSISRVDVDRAGPHFTVDMLGLLRAELGLAAPDQLVFLMGADSLVDLPTWRQPLDIARQALLAVVDRPGSEPDMTALERVLPGISPSVRFVPMPLVGISGTDIRGRVAAGRPIRYQVPAAVERYIRRERLYGAATTRGDRASGNDETRRWQ